jgi:hypothetical protein
MRLVLLAALLAAAPAALAQTDTLLVVPGDGQLVTDWITPGTTDYTLRLLSPMQQDVGSTTETITVEDGAVTRVSALSVPMQGVEQRDSLRADAATLAPLLHRSAGGAADVSLEFLPEGVAGTVAPRSGETEAVMEMTDTPVFDAAWLGEIAQSLPLAEGLVARVPVYSAQGGLTDAVLTVTGREEVERDGAARTAWVVEMVLGPQTLTQLVDAETRESLGLRLSPQPGVELEIVEAD